MGLLPKLEYQQGLSYSEKEIANYIIHHKDEVITMKISQLAKKTYTSPATISRFCRKLGLEGYREFQLHFATLIQGESQSEVNYNHPFQKDDDIQHVITNISSIYQETIDDTNEVLDFHVLKQVADLIDQVPVLDVYAWGDLYLSALNFEHKMTYINQMVSLKHIPSEQNQRAIYLHKKTVALVISYSGETDDMKKVVKIIKERGGQVIAITSLDDSYLKQHADYCLFMCSKENIINKIAAYSSKISSDYILDLLYSLIFQKNYQNLMDQKVNLTQCHNHHRNKTMEE